VSFSSRFRYTDDMLSINSNRWFDISQRVGNQRHHRVFHICFVFIYLNEIGYKLVTQKYDKQDDFNFSIINFPYLCSNIPISPAYGVYMLQLIRYARAFSTYDQFADKQVEVTGFLQSRLQAAFYKFYGCHNDLVYQCNLPLSQILSDVFHTKC
jgi:hypothetical protein